MAEKIAHKRARVGFAGDEPTPGAAGTRCLTRCFFVSNRSFERSNVALSMVIVNQDTLLPGVSGLHGLLDVWHIPGTEHMSEVERWWEHVRGAYLGYKQELA